MQPFFYSSLHFSSALQAHLAKLTPECSNYKLTLVHKVSILHKLRIIIVKQANHYCFDGLYIF